MDKENVVVLQGNITQIVKKKQTCNFKENVWN